MSNGENAVGVVIVVRNMRRYLARAIESVLTQRPAPIDVVVVDGASIDGSAAVARAFPNVRVLDQNGVGLAAARNQGLTAVKGGLVAFCDADDRWAADSLALRLAALQANSGAVAVIGRAVLEEIDGAGTTSAQRHRLGHNIAGFTPGALLVRRQAFGTIGVFDEELTIGSDSDWFVRLLQSSVPWMQIEATVLHKGMHDGSLSTDVVRYRRELFTIARRFVSRQRRKSVE